MENDLAEGDKKKRPGLIEKASPSVYLRSNYVSRIIVLNSVSKGVADTFPYNNPRTQKKQPVKSEFDVIDVDNDHCKQPQRNSWTLKNKVHKQRSGEKKNFTSISLHIYPQRRKTTKSKENDYHDLPTGAFKRT